jgi:hypothetical protein
MLVKITSGNVDTYPYSAGQLRRDNPNTSFPKQVPDAILAGYGVYPVTFAAQPDIDERTQKVEQEAQPTLVGGNWTIGWTTSSKTAEEIAEYDADAAASVRAERDGLLAQSDWTQVADAPVDATAWATYRQALRDITDQASFPYDINWPTQP